MQNTLKVNPVLYLTYSPQVWRDVRKSPPTKAAMQEYILAQALDVNHECQYAYLHPKTDLSLNLYNLTVKEFAEKYGLEVVVISKSEYESKKANNKLQPEVRFADVSAVYERGAGNALTSTINPIRNTESKVKKQSNIGSNNSSATNNARDMNMGRKTQKDLPLPRSTDQMKEYILQRLDKKTITYSHPTTEADLVVYDQILKGILTERAQQLPIPQNYEQMREYVNQRIKGLEVKYSHPNNETGLAMYDTIFQDLITERTTKSKETSFKITETRNILSPTQQLDSHNANSGIMQRSVLPSKRRLPETKAEIYRCYENIKKYGSDPQFTLEVSPDSPSGRFVASVVQEIRAREKLGLVIDNKFTHDTFGTPINVQSSISTVQNVNTQPSGIINSYATSNTNQKQVAASSSTSVSSKNNESYLDAKLSSSKSTQSIKIHNVLGKQLKTRSKEGSNKLITQNKSHLPFATTDVEIEQLIIEKKQGLPVSYQLDMQNQHALDRYMKLSSLMGRKGDILISNSGNSSTDINKLMADMDDINQGLVAFMQDLHTTSPIIFQNDDIYVDSFIPAKSSSNVKQKKAPSTMVPPKMELDVASSSANDMSSFYPSTPTFDQQSTDFLDFDFMQGAPYSPLDLDQLMESQTFTSNNGIYTNNASSLESSGGGVKRQRSTNEETLNKKINHL